MTGRSRARYTSRADCWSSWPTPPTHSMSPTSNRTDERSSTAPPEVAQRMMIYLLHRRQPTQSGLMFHHSLDLPRRSRSQRVTVGQDAHQKTGRPRRPPALLLKARYVALECTQVQLADDLPDHPRRMIGTHQMVDHQIAEPSLGAVDLDVLRSRFRGVLAGFHPSSVQWPKTFSNRNVR